MGSVQFMAANRQAQDPSIVTVGHDQRALVWRVVLDQPGAGSPEKGGRMTGGSRGSRGDDATDVGSAAPLASRPRPYMSGVVSLDAHHLPSCAPPSMPTAARWQLAQ